MKQGSKNDQIHVLWHMLMENGTLCNCALEAKFARFECRDCAEGLEFVENVIDALNKPGTLNKNSKP